LLEGINILVAEDNVVNQMIIKFFLRKQNAAVTIAENGNDAVAKLRDGNFDLVLMDLQMPGMDGYATTRYIREEMKSDIPIIALTADMFVAETHKCMDVGMNACLSKPYEPKDLSKLILELTKSRQSITV
jgi:CheY-like chemotaxis protein